MEAVREFFFWLDGAPWRFWTPAWLLFGATAFLALRPQGQTTGKLNQPGWFIAAVFLTLLAFRWPTWFYRLDLNPDEAQIVSGALTLDRFLLPWKHLDPTTHGPLCEYFLVFASWLGAPFNYVTARVVAALLQAGALVAVWATLRRIMDESPARLAVLPGLAFWSLTSWDDFLHYSSELPGIFLMAWGGYYLVRTLLTPTERPAVRTAFLAGCLLGAVPYGKLQSTPHAGLIGLIGLVLVWRLVRDQAVRWRRLAGLIGGAVTPSVLHGLYLTVFGLWGQFWFTYIVSAVDFLDTSAHRFADMPGRFLHLAATSPSFSWFFWGNLAFALLYLRSPRRSELLRAAIPLAGISLAAAWFTVIRPGRESAHYLHLLVIPVTTLAGVILGNAWPDQPAAGVSRAWKTLGAFALLALGPQALNQAVAYHRFVGHAQRHWEAPLSGTAAYLRARLLPGDTLAMWGWAPHLHVETQLPHATREAQSGNQIMQWPLTDFFVDRYLGDLARWRPVWFVDAVGPGAFIFDDRTRHAHESVPALRQWIADHYDFVAEIAPLRIYRLKDVERPVTAANR
ncbi:hypothetical protein ESB00_05025 [Oleiharenicola lentus]|uniref:Glycosyltransferase RgtA/B/C/D-like domain-containing protein n=1 Tax=Oleiharenicola lentus TaxID=2508720 RepID=A0A4Q1C8V7_9BACT|nr:hypothetical protein [Oleiharenicola lentus]RXK55262.1 hypothetical protein ESB00_05025 [Oleiharenicola lentus]